MIWSPFVLFPRANSDTVIWRSEEDGKGEARFQVVTILVVPNFHFCKRSVFWELLGIGDLRDLGGDPLTGSP